ncbi:MAG: cardiolipin synthase ClsB [Proteobacteria bacterium]|nr:cardiolipin synthase ClsB [Pseudomonadota bacterium]
MVRWSSKKRRVSDIPGASWARYCRFPDAFIVGNRIELLVDGEEAYPAMLQAIAAAKNTVLMESYIFHDDPAGRAFSQQLRRQAQNGVQVYLIVDGVGTLHVSGEFFEEMEAAGVHVLIYRSPAPWRRSFGIFHRDHRKLLVVDGHIGFTGGLNIGKEWLAKGEGGDGWHDIHVRIDGPVVRGLAKLALSTWRVHGGITLDQRVFLPTVSSKGTVHASIIGSRERKKRQAMRQSYLQAIRRSQKYIYITNAYFLPGRGYQRAIRNACRRGVDVRIMIPEQGDILPARYASQALYRRFLRMGAKLYLWKVGVLHAKTAVIDDEWCTVGSFNIDRRSLTMNLEVNLNSVGPPLTTQLRNLFVKDQANCERLTLEKWSRRSWFTRILESFFYRFRNLM